MTSIIDTITTQIREARLTGDTKKKDELVTLKSYIMHGLSQKQPVTPQKTIRQLVTSYKQTKALALKSGAVALYQYKIDLLESLLADQPMLDTNAMEQLLVDNDFANMKEWQLYLKTEYPDRYDAGLAATLFTNGSSGR